MESLILLIPLSLMAVAVAIACFFSMSESGQFDDTEGPAWSVVLDDDSTPDHGESMSAKSRGLGDGDSLDLDQNPEREDQYSRHVDKIERKSQ